MAGLEKIIGEIHAESDGLIREVLDRAQKEAAQIRSEAEKKAGDSVERIRRESDARLADSKSRAQSAAALTKRQLLLQEKQNLIGEVLEKAKETFLALPEAEYFDTLLALLKKNALSEQGEILLNERDRKRLPADFEKKAEEAAKAKGGSLRVSEKTREIDGGLILVYEGIEQNCSVDALFETNIEMLQDKIQNILFA
jgi:ATP synthase, subunit E